MPPCFARRDESTRRRPYWRTPRSILQAHLRQKHGEPWVGAQRLVRREDFEVRQHRVPLFVGAVQPFKGAALLTESSINLGDSARNGSSRLRTADPLLKQC